MLFIGTQAVLIEVKTNNQDYLIGDQVLKTIPTQIFQKILVSANWNRALRYLAQEVSGFSSLGFFLVRFDLYLQDSQVCCLAKNHFEQKILNQTCFQKSFLQEIFNFRGRNYLNFSPKTLPKSGDLEIIAQIDSKLDFNRCWVSENFKIKNQKYKVLFKKGPSFRIEKTSKNQIIYYSDFDFCQVDLFDSKTGIFYEQGKYSLNVDVWLTFRFENQELKQKFLEQLVTEIKTNSQIPSNHKNWHLFNVTADFVYLVQELQQLVKKFIFWELLDYLEKLFKELKINYNSLLFSVPELKNIFLTAKLKSEEKAHLQHLFARYGVLNEQDLELLKTK